MSYYVYQLGKNKVWISYAPKLPSEFPTKTTTETKKKSAKKLF